MILTEKTIEETTMRFFENAAESGFALREGQLAMAMDICAALKNKQPLAVEAGVGIGKSFAYLVPCLLQYFRERQQIIIATSTIALQEQLARDMQTVLKMLGVRANVLLAKGMKNYLCLRRLESCRNRKNVGNIERIWQATQLGRQDRAGLGFSVSDKEWEAVCITACGESCKDCAYAQNCEYSKLRASLQSGGDIVICNQNMLVAHMMNGGFFSTSVSAIVIDEAHNLESKFREAYTESFGKSDILRILKTVTSRCQHSNAAMKLKNDVVTDTEALFSEMNKQIHAQQTATDGDLTRYILTKNKEVKKHLFAVRRNLAALHDDFGCEIMRILYFLRAVSRNENLVWLTKETGTRLCVCKKDIRDDISKLLFAPNRTTILTSATIADKQSGTANDKYAYYLYSIGFPTNGMVSEPKKSPFDYSRNAVLFCSKALPYPNQENREQYRTQSIDEIVRLLSMTNGKTLILFTAKSDMEFVYKKLSNLHLPYKILKQSGSSSQAHRLESFTNDVNSVILGCGAFWEGINVEGESLSQVIIFKLPFPVPEPILEYKMSLVENPIEAVAVPEMILKLKQGAGRLIRSSTDTGIISVLDPRASGKYAETIRAALPDMQLAFDMDVLSDIRHRITKTKEAA